MYWEVLFDATYVASDATYDVYDTYVLVTMEDLARYVQLQSMPPAYSLSWANPYHFTWMFRVNLPCAYLVNHLLETFHLVTISIG